LVYSRSKFRKVCVDGWQNDLRGFCFGWFSFCVTFFGLNCVFSSEKNASPATLPVVFCDRVALLQNFLRQGDLLLLGSNPPFTTHAPLFARALTTPGIRIASPRSCRCAQFNAKPAKTCTWALTALSDDKETKGLLCVVKMSIFRRSHTLNVKLDG
jgi:hypothetical protein